MATEPNELIKHRQINFCSLHPDPTQAQNAMLLLSDVGGITHLHLPHQHVLHISYDIRYIYLKMIEDALEEVGFHLDNSLLFKLKRALYHYTEEVQRQNLGLHNKHSNSTQKIFVSRYEKLRHGCRDDRPAHWRKYL
jgi:hypothetical protein